MTDSIITRLSREAEREPHEPIWMDAIAEIESLRAQVDRLRGPIRTGEAIDWSLPADELARQWRAMAMDLADAVNQED